VRTPLLVALAWLTVSVLYLTGAAAVLPPLLLLATASLLRGGRTLLDRLVLALFALLGAACLAGLVFSVWPFGLHPVPVAGSAATALIVLAARTGRRPQLPRPRGADAIALGCAAVVAAVAAWPVAHATPSGRLAILLDGEDLARHAAVFDAIRHLGGYLFLDRVAAGRLVYGGMIDYPQGSHLAVALLDGFARSSDRSFGSGTAMLEHYLIGALAGYALLALALIWAAQWLAAGALTTTRAVALAALVAAVCGFGEMVELLSFGYPSQVLGLAAAVVLLALLARPLPRARDQLLVVSLLLAAVGFTYYLYLPPVGLAYLVWLSRRRWTRTSRLMSLACGVVAAGPMTYGLLVAHQGDALFTIGYLVLSRGAIAALAVAVATGLLTRRGRRSRIWRRYALTFVPVAAFAGVLLVGQRMFGVGSGYYANKALYLVFALLLAGAGATALHLPRPAAARRRSLPFAVPAVLAIAALTGAGRGNQPDGISWGEAWLRGADAGRVAQADVLLAAYTRFPASPPTLVVGDDAGLESYRMTLFLSTMQRTSGDTAGAIYNHLPVTSPGRLDAAVDTYRSVRLLALSDAALDRARAVAARHPAVQVEVVRI
jgi:hypothetical protein